MELNATINVSLTASDLQASIRFYTEGLGFTIIDRHEPEGVLRFVQMRAGDAMVGVGQDDFALGRDRKKGQGMRIWFRTSADITALAAQAKAAGFSLDGEPAPLAWGPMAFQVSDPDGFKITVQQV
jgi:catechol 2,3-dioxygenase-like lactoylglutathione lyase family enzyme